MSNEQRRIGPYEPFRNRDLTPGTTVGRVAYFHPGSPRIVTGSPCCAAVVYLDLDDFRYALEARTKGFDSYLVEAERRCSDCGSQYRLHPAEPEAGKRIETVGRLELRQFCIDWTAS